MDASAPLQLFLLGHFRVAVHGRVIPDESWTQRRAAGIVKLLALAPAHRRHREELIEALWPGLGGEAAANNLRVAMTRARRVLEANGAEPGRFLTRDGESYVLAAQDCVGVDVDVFESAVLHAWATGEPTKARQALEWYSGDLLPEDRYEDWAGDRRLALRTSYLALLAHLGARFEERHEFGHAIATWQRVVLAEPLDEGAHVALMSLFARVGESRQAIVQYERLTSLLDAELGVEPSAAARDLMTAIHAGQFPPATEPYSPTIECDESINGKSGTLGGEQVPGLPAPLDELIGREREVREVQRLLAARRLVTLTGPAGVGKTRLAVAAARNAAGAFSATTAFADLAPIRDPTLVLPTITRALGIVEAGKSSLLAATAVHLGETPFLLVVDNFEHVLPAAPTVSDLLATCPGLRIIVTSRAPLRIRGEQEYPVTPLAVPEPSHQAIGETGLAASRRSPAVELFVQRARAARPNLSPSDGDVEAIASICRRLDGLPLAIELAAARVRVLSPTALLTRLERPLATLTVGLRDVPDRQRTLRAAIDWSFGLLDEATQALFMRLAVFPGSFNLNAATAIGAENLEREADAATGTDSDTLDLITRLVEQSLLQRTAETEDGPRFSLLATMRDFATERLAASGALESTRLRHANWFLATAEQAEPELVGANAATWLDHLELDHDNLRAALTTFAESDHPELALRLAGALWRFWWLHGHLTEGRSLLEWALAQGSLAHPAMRAKAFDGAGALAAAQGDLPSAVARHSAALDLWRALGDRQGIVNALTHLGLVADERGDPERAAAYLHEALPLARATGNRRSVAVVLANLGQVAMTRLEHDRATTYLAESSALFSNLGDRQSQAAILANLGVLAFHMGDFLRAESCHETALTLLRALADPQGEADELLNLAHTVQQQGDLERAAHLLAEALEQFTRLGDRSGQAFACNHLGRLAHLQGNHAEAEARLQDGFTLGQEIGDHVAAVEAMEGLAAIACACGDTLRCARLLGASSGTRERLGVPLPPVHRAALDGCITEAQRALGTAAFAIALGEGRAYAVGQLENASVRDLVALAELRPSTGP